MCATGCTTRGSVFDVTVTSEPIAVGAAAHGQLQSVSCSETDCDSAAVKVLSMEISPPGVFDTPQRGTRADNFVIPAIGEGTATFTITGNDGDATRTFTRELTALAANRATGALAYDKIVCPMPVRFGPGVNVEMPFELWRDDLELVPYGLVPFVVEGAQVDVDVSQFGTIHLDLPSAAGAVSITSTIDPSFTASAEIIAPTMIDGITLSGPDEPLQILDVATLTVAVSAGGVVVCGDAMSRTARTLTPDVCKINGPSPREEWVDVGMHAVDVAGVKSGTCTITVTNAITGPSATTSFEVTM